MSSTNDLQKDYIQSKYVSQLTRDPLHTDHIMRDEVYFPFWMNALNVYDLFYVCIPSNTSHQFGAWWRAICYQLLYPTVPATKTKLKAGFS